MKREKVNIVILTAILILIVAALLIIKLSKGTSNESPKDSNKQVAQLDVAPPNGGVITYEAPLNSKVKKGQTVLKIDSLQYAAQVDADRAKLFDDEQIYGRDLKLSKGYKNDVISEQELLTAMYSVKQDEATSKVDESYVKQCSIKSPFNGTVTKIINYQGSGVGNGNEIMDITANS